MLDSKVRLSSLLVCLVLCVSSQAKAQSVADLELRAPAQDVVAGTTFEVELYAVANPGPNQDVGDVRAILSWDDSVLLFTGIHIDTGHTWQQSSFFGDPDGLNDDVSDGLAVYRAIAVPGDPGSADLPGNQRRPGICSPAPRFRKSILPRSPNPGTGRNLEKPRAI